MSERLLSMMRTVTWRGKNGPRVLLKGEIRPPHVRRRKVVRGLSVKDLGGGASKGVNLTIERDGAVAIKDWTKESETHPDMKSSVVTTSIEQINDRVPSLSRRIGLINVDYRARKI